MKSKTFIWLVIGCNVVIALLFIHRQSLFVKQIYKKQRLEQQKNTQQQHQDELTKQLYILKNPNTVAAQARQKLGMNTINIKQVRKVVPQ